MSGARPFRRLSLDLKLIASYLLVLGVGGVAISSVGSWIVATTMRREAQRAVDHDLALAQLALSSTARPRDDATLVAELGSRLYGGDPERGTIALFRGRTCVAAAPPGRRAPGDRAAGALSAAVLDRGEEWHGRAEVGGEAYLGAVAPLRDAHGRVAGMLEVAVPERTFTATRNRVISSFVAIASLGFVLVIALTYRIIHVLTRPIRQMVEATRSVAAGRFDHPVAVDSEGEIGILAQSINAMQASLRQMRADLEEAARTLEDKVHARTADLARMQARMAQSERLASIGVLAAGVAHEINNPLGGILALTALTLEDLPAADPHRENQRGELEASLDVVEPARLASWRSNLEEVVRQTRRCGEIVKHLLEFSRQHRVSAEPVDVNALVERTLALLERQSIFLNVKVERRLDPALPAVVADPSQLQQVFVNVLVNAVQAMEERGTLTVATGHDPRTGEVVLTFRDTGCGIPADQLDRIFDPFFTTKESGQGTGLGLSIAYGIVSRHSGTIGVESTPGAGTTLSIRLPAGASRELAAVPQEVTA